MKNIAILGAGISGTGSAVLAKVKGFNVFLSDKGTIKDEYIRLLEQYQIEYESGHHSEERILSADEIVKSPGIPESNPLIQKARAKNIPIISEIEFAGRYDDSCKICITGSNGKTTTTSLIYHILTLAGYNVGLGGNIGRGYALQVATEKFDYYVLELSSFQLDGMYDFKADTAILCNITPDHLDRYDYKFENYARSKFRILQNMTSEDRFIFCSDDPMTQQCMKDIDLQPQALRFSIQGAVEGDGGYEKDGSVTVRYRSEELTLPVSELSLKGKHNIYNSIAAAAAALTVGVAPKTIIEGLKTFAPVEHRLEPAGSIDGVTFINDSKATNVDSTWYALESMTTPVVWIAGGTDKGNDYAPIYKFVKDKVTTLICLGVDNKKLHDCFADKVDRIVDVLSAKDAVAEGLKAARPGDCVLLSPACASFDLFKSYEDRGRQFKAAVKELQK